MIGTTRGQLGGARIELKSNYRMRLKCEGSMSTTKLYRTPERVLRSKQQRLENMRKEAAVKGFNTPHESKQSIYKTNVNTKSNEFEGIAFNNDNFNFSNTFKTSFSSLSNIDNVTVGDLHHQSTNATGYYRKGYHERAVKRETTQNDEVQFSNLFHVETDEHKGNNIFGKIYKIVKSCMGIKISKKYKVLLVSPENMQDCWEDCLYCIQKRKILIFVTKHLSREEAQRSVDALAGASLVLGGRVDTIAEDSYLFAPRGTVTSNLGL